MLMQRLQSVKRKVCNISEQRKNLWKLNMYLPEMQLNKSAIGLFPLCVTEYSI